MKPESAAFHHGSESCSSCERKTDVNSQVRMMSCACGRRSSGNVRSNRSRSSGQPQTICGDSDEVAQVSITSGSATKPFGCPRWPASYPSGTSVEGSTGSCSALAAIGSA